MPVRTLYCLFKSKSCCWYTIGKTTSWILGMFLLDTARSRLCKEKEEKFKDFAHVSILQHKNICTYVYWIALSKLNHVVKPWNTFVLIKSDEYDDKLSDINWDEWSYHWESAGHFLTWFVFVFTSPLWSEKKLLWKLNTSPFAFYQYPIIQCSL